MNQPQQIDPSRMFTLNLNAATIGVILEGLHELPAKKSIVTILGIHKAIEDQINQPPEPVESPNADAEA